MALVREGAALLKLFLLAALAGLLTFLAGHEAYRLGGKYVLQEHDRGPIMVAGPSGDGYPAVRVLLVGNSLTYVKDVPGMLANIAAADPGLPVRLEVESRTRTNATLDQLLQNTDAVAWMRLNRPTRVIVQEHSGWYLPGSGLEGIDQALAPWRAAADGIGAKVDVFEDWGDGDGDKAYDDPHALSFGLTPDEDARRSAEATAAAAQRLGLGVVPVGDAFAKARHAPEVPDVYQADRHHADVAGAYLAALVLYRRLTGRDGAESRYRPLGLSDQQALRLVRIASG